MLFVFAAVLPFAARAESGLDAYMRGKVFRMWVNDDADKSDSEEDPVDIPKQSNADCKDGVVNGRRDLVDFFPLWINISSFGRDVMMDVCGETDTNGEASVVFLCKSMNFSYTVRADGYYGAGGGIGFAREGSGFTLRQTQFETNICVQVKPIVNPIPMFVGNRPESAGRQLKYPGKAHFGSWGFDLKAGDWVRPFGTGEIADFTVEYSDLHYASDKALDCALVFTNAVQDGCYIAECTGTRFRSDYVANTNAVYMKRLDFESWGQKYVGRYASKLIGDNQYVVIRTRTRCDDKGRLVSACYAKIYGPIRFLGGMNFVSYFNPNENDPNLEADTAVDLMQGGGIGFAP